MHEKYLGLTPERFAALSKRYAEFQDTCDDVTKDPVKVFSPLTEKALAELLLNRGVSVDLQKKKEEDMKKQAQAAEETPEEKPEDKSEDTEEKTPETQK